MRKGGARDGGNDSIGGPGPGGPDLSGSGGPGDQHHQDGLGYGRVQEHDLSDAGHAGGERLRAEKSGYRQVLAGEPAIQPGQKRGEPPAEE